MTMNNIATLTNAEIEHANGGSQCTQATAQYGGAVATVIAVGAVGSGPLGWAALAVAAYAGFSAVPEISEHCGL